MPDGARATPGRAAWPWLAWALVVFVLDQLTKALILRHYQLGDATPVTGFFNIVRAHNSGAAFSFLAAAGGWQRWLFVAIGVVVGAFILRQLWRHPGRKLYAFALASILGGAVGNVVDRLQHGYVVDFLDFHWAWLASLFYAGHFPAFNLADAAITLGAACLILQELLQGRRQD
ncbi:MAG: signal peptidase II [Comamonadaceae bacterium]|nr:signal peptidase II [Burkholderiales bacterium]MEB2348030.1 signal peptidase II [Comamonadaceae bacterium]